MFRSIACLAAVAGLVALPASAQEKKSSTMNDAGEVASQPVRDVGIGNKKIPPVLLDAADDPYLPVASCAGLTAGIRALNAELGPDFGAEPGKKPSVIKTGSAAVVNTLIPFRGIVREVSGAAAADRRLAAATQAGIARRGYLRGTYQARRCRTGM